MVIKHFSQVRDLLESKYYYTQKDISCAVYFRVRSNRGCGLIESVITKDANGGNMVYISVSIISMVFIVHIWLPVA